MHKHNDIYAEGLPDLLCVQSILNNFQSLLYFPKTKEETFSRDSLKSRDLVNRDSEGRNVTEISKNWGIVSKKQIWVKRVNNTRK